MKEIVKQYIRQFHMVSEGDHITVALSGGADSVALLLLLLELRQELSVSVSAIHVEHGIRGEESEQDAVFVNNLCESLSVPLLVSKIDVPAYAKMQHLGLEEAARVLRYQVFEECGGKIALAHHMDDQAETVLFQMARGSGLKGLTGMQPVRREEKVTYLRPLLSVSRERIERYLCDCAQDYRVDSTNEDESYSRNFIRKTLLPELERLNASAKKHFAQTAERLGEVEEYMQLQTQDAFAKCVEEQYEFSDLCTELALRVDVLQSFHPAIQKRVLRMGVDELTHSLKDVEERHIRLLAELLSAKEGATALLPNHVRAYRDEGLLVLMYVPSGEIYSQLTEEEGKDEILPLRITKEALERLKSQERADRYEVVTTQGKSVGLLEISVVPCIKNDTFFLKKSCQKYIDYDKIISELVIRGRKEGDTFLLNLKGEHKLLQREFIDAKIPEYLRDEMIVFADEKKLAAICQKGEYAGRVSADYYVSDSTAYMIEIKESIEDF